MSLHLHYGFATKAIRREGFVSFHQGSSLKGWGERCVCVLYVCVRCVCKRCMKAEVIMTHEISVAEHWIRKWEAARGRGEIWISNESKLRGVLMEKRWINSQFMALHQRQSLILTKFQKAVNNKASWVKRGLKFHTILYSSQQSLQSQSSLLWLPDFIIIKQLFPSKNSSERLNNTSRFFIEGK